MNHRFRLSLLVVQIFVLTLMVALLGRLFYLQVAAAPKYKDAALSIQSRDVINPAIRGLIVDSSGVPLALNRVGLAITVDRIALDKQSDKGAIVLASVSNLLGLAYADVYRATRLCGELPKNDKAGCWTGSRYQPIPITKEADPEIALQIVERTNQFPGIGATPVGLEYQYDSFLRGTPGIRTVIVDRKESITRESQNTAPIGGNHLVTSLDVRLQASVESALSDAVGRARASGYPGDSGAAIVMDVRNGQILAMASYPTYDPNAWEKGLSVKDARALFSEKNNVPALSRPLQGLFAPASTFKSVSVVAAANAGYNLNAIYNCPSETQIGNRAFQNFDSKALGRISLKKGIAVSCDTLWYQIAYDEWVRDGGLRPKSDPNDYFFKAAEGFQVNKKTGIDMPSELSGRLANRQWRNDWYAENKDFYCNYKDRAAKNQLTPFLIELARENCLDGDKIRAGDAVNFSIGQGDTIITPLKLTQMYAAIANGGKILRPSVAKAVVSTDGKVIKKISAKQLGTLPATQTTLNFLQDALREAVTAGTATGAFAGFPVAISGKTGTAQVFGRNANGTLKADTSWFASYGPTQNPRYAVVMMVSQGGFGASVSGVGVRKIYETLFGVTGSKVDPAKAIFPDGKPPIKIPKISPSTKVKESK